jgi:phosphonate transport system permease protein
VKFSRSHALEPGTEAIDLPPRPTLWTEKTAWVLITLGAIALSAYQAGLGQWGRELVNWNGIPQVWQFVTASVSPDFSPEFLTVIARATLVTLAYAVVGTGLSVALGMVGGIVSSAIWWRTLFPEGSALAGLSRWFWLLVRGLLAFPRAIHELIWGLVLLQIFGLDPLVAIGAIAIPFGAIVSKVFSEILDETPHQPLYNLLNAGISPPKALLYGLLPQALPNLLSYAFYRFECSLRSAAVLGIIGAGGLGYEIFLSLQSLRYDQLWTGFYALIVLNGAVDAWSALVRRRMGFTSRLDLNYSSQAQGTNAPYRRAKISKLSKWSQGQKSDHHPRDGDLLPAATLHPQHRDWFLRLSWFGVALAIPLSLFFLDINWAILIAPRTRELWGDLWASAVPALPSVEELRQLISLAYLTLAMAILAGAMAGVGGVFLSFPAAQNMLLPGGLLQPVGQHKNTFPWFATAVLGFSRLVLLVSRAIPAPIWALVFLFVLFPGILPGALALAVHNFGILGRLMAEVNENLDDRPVRALRSLGASSGQVMVYGILPQNLPRFLAYILYRWEVCLRETVIVGLVGAGGLGRRLTEQISSFDYGGVVMTLGVFVGLTIGVDLVSNRMRQTIR